MALTINGTTGLAGLDGSASSPVFKGTDSNTGLSFGTDIVNINTGGSTRYQIDGSGDIQCGGSNPVFTGSSLSSLKIAAPNGSARYFFGEIGDSAHAALSVYDSSGSQKIRISASPTDHTFFNQTSKSIFGATSTFDTVSSARVQISGGGAAGLAITGNSTGGQSRLSFFNPNGRVGFINTSGSSTGYNTSSDYRLKENAVAISDGITRLKTLKPYRFNWKSDASTTVDGFFAHEVTAVPEAVTGEKDGEEMQAIDQSKLVPLLTAALQEAVGKIETLETKVAALEAA